MEEDFVYCGHCDCPLYHCSCNYWTDRCGTAVCAAAFDTGADPAYDEWTLKEGGVVLMKAAPPLFVPATRQSPKAAKILAATYDAGTCISKRPMGEPSVF